MSSATDFRVTAVLRSCHDAGLRCRTIPSSLALGVIPVASADIPAVSTYVLGPNDQISVRVLNLDEVGSQAIRIDMQGNINLALAGRIHAGGLTVDALEDEIARRLRSYLLTPTVSVGVVEYRSQPISILGSVNQPGVHQLQGQLHLFEALSLANGLRPDAGDEIKITRQKGWVPFLWAAPPLIPPASTAWPV